MGDLGVLTCFGTRTGDILWQKRIGGDFSSSPVFADGRIYICDQDGKTTVVQPDERQYIHLAENQLDGQIMASPAISEQAIYMRTDSHLYRLETAEPYQGE